MISSDRLKFRCLSTW